MIEFDKNILIIGCGAVAQCSIPIICKEIFINPKNITIIDPIDNKDKIQKILDKGAQFFIEKITKDNHIELLQKYLKPEDICIDLANEVDTIDVLKWCQNNNVNYLNTDINNWKQKNSPNLFELYVSILNFVKKSKFNGPTSILAHGANPGLISSFVKITLLKIAEKIIEKDKNKEKILSKLINENNFSQLAYHENILTIHVSEEDNQNGISKKKNEFLNTWSIPEFINESVLNCEFSWGTHEKNVPKNSKLDDGVITLESLGFKTKLKSFVFDKEIVGISPSHTENFSIADYLSIRENGKNTYRPTTIFVYDPNPSAKSSLIELDQRKLKPQKNQHIINKEIISGSDKMGCLLMGHEFNSWWTGSLLSIEESNKILPNQNATTMQVAAGVISALKYIINNPNKGILFPEQLDHNEILKTALPYLGNFISEPINWKPKNPTDWQFEEFLISKL